jgi:alpha-L-rhamnosidase
MGVSFRRDDLDAIAAAVFARRNRMERKFLQRVRAAIGASRYEKNRIPDRLSFVFYRAVAQLMDSQASYAIPLALGVFNDENKPYAIKFLNEAVQRKNKDDGGVERPAYSLMTGFIGTASISGALSSNGSDDLAYRLLVQKDYPSWLYPVVNGATSIWERLNSYTVEDGFGGNNSMNSFNHYSFGAVAASMYNYSLGIQRHPEKTGFKEFILKPTPDPNNLVAYAKGHDDSVYGRIASEWKVEGDKLIYKATVPHNTTAKLYLPAKSVNQIFENGQPVTKWGAWKRQRTG